ncbi:unnamed protein product [Euphydryas editha]|uniref:Uncharacterized protein n=1 Tax=Euphydryas editha TaxID=104508 RepID=A0AAU9U343_EUPED|nr:unnamed protein product [Euphydryas editha]
MEKDNASKSDETGQHTSDTGIVEENREAPTESYKSRIKRSIISEGDCSENSTRMGPVCIPNNYDNSDSDSIDKGE